MSAKKKLEPWQELLAEVRAMTPKEGGRIHFDRLQILAEMETDDECRKYLEERGQTAEDIYAQLRGGVACSIDELWEMWRMFPDRDDWANMLTLYGRYQKQLKENRRLRGT